MSEMPRTKEQEANTYSVEQAVPEDAKGIVDVQINTWIATYINEELGITEDSIIKRFFGKNGELLKDRIERNKKRIANSPYGVFVAKNGDKIVGFTSPRYDEKGNQQRVGALYVLPEAQGHGLGKKLLGKSLDALDKTQDIYLHVITYNKKAIEFYERNDFIKTGKDVTGSIDPLPNGAVIPEIEMKLPGELVVR